MTSDKKAREFNLHFNFMADNPRVEVASDNCFIKNNEVIRVIEHSAFEALQKRCEIAEKERDILRAQRNYHIRGYKSEVEEGVFMDTAESYDIEIKKTLEALGSEK